MALDITADQPAGPVWRPRSGPEVIRDQVAGIDAWNRARRALELALDADQAGAGSREMRLDLARQLDVLRRQQQAIVERTEQHLRGSDRLLQATAPARAVIAHRNDWFSGKVTVALRGHGIEVVAQLDNGADAVGVSVAEQPDLLLVEDKLAMINGEDVVRQVRQYAPSTIAAAQVSFEGGIPAFLDAGAVTAFPRRIPPGDVAKDLAELVRV